MDIKSIFILIVTAIILSACNQPTYDELSINSSSIEELKLMIDKIEQKGPRNAGTLEEEFIGESILGILNEQGINCKREIFTYNTFILTEKSISLGGNSYEPTFVGINPFSGSKLIEAEAYIYDPERESSISPEGRIVISDNPDIFFLALQRSAIAFVALDEKDFDSIKNLETSRTSLSISGKHIESKSANLIADIGNNPDGTETVYITAHYDSYLDSPGANDNGTGVCSAITLAGLLKDAEKSLPYNVKIIFPAAEEIGLVGSRSYLSSHLQDLKTIKCLINLDTFGGDLAPFIAASPGISGSPESGYIDPTPYELKDRALEGPYGSWRMFDASLFSIIVSSNYPQWYQEIVSLSADNLEYDISTQQLMSDHLTFAAAGVPSISIQSREHTIHSKNDIGENINYESVERCLSLSLEIIKEVMSQNAGRPTLSDN